MNKADYREYLLCVKRFVKLSQVCNVCNVSRSNLSWFMAGRDELISIEKLEMMVNFIENEMLETLHNTHYQKLNALVPFITSKSLC